MWKQLIAPTLLVAGLWFLVSPLTTYCIYWLDESYQRALTSNLQSMHAGAEIREYTWRIVSYAGFGNSFSTGESQASIDDMAGRVQLALSQLRLAARSHQEKQLAIRLNAICQEFLKNARPKGSDPSRSAAFRRFRQLSQQGKAITSTVNEIRELNQRESKAAHAHREHWKVIITAVRIVVLIVGPGIALALGFWISKKIHRSISQINIILKDANVEWEENVGRIKLSSSENLGELRERVEKIVDHLTQVNRELATARGETLRSERLAAVGELAAGVAHELRNPLTSVKLLLQNAAQSPGDTKLNDDETCVVIDEILRMENTIQGLLDFSRPPSPQRHRHDIRSTLQRALNLVQGRANQQEVDVISTMPEQPVMMDGDAEQIHQVFVNLLINGIEASPAGVLRVAMDVDENEGAVRICFRDTGPGIPPDVLVHLFEPFVSSKQRGTGLGLAISRRIVMQHDGFITAENHTQGGAMFTVQMPLSGPSEQPAVMHSDRILLSH